MRAAHITALDGPGGIEIVELEDPTPGPRQVVIGVEAAGVNFPDLLMSRGQYQLAPQLPFAPGGEVAGTVLAVGDGTEVEVGTRVMALTGWNGFATHVTTAANRCIRVPDTMSTRTASAFAFTYGTTLHGLVDRGRIEAGDELLVLGAAGGVGSAAVELGVALGAHVIAAASTDDKLALCKELGAHDTINYARDDLKKQAKKLGSGGVDVVYDPVGGPLSEQALRALRPGGRHLVIGFASGEIPSVAWNLPLLKQCSVVGVAWGAWALANPADNARNMQRLFELHAAGKVGPKITAEFSLDEVPEALRALDERRIMGKAIVVP